MYLVFHERVLTDPLFGNRDTRRNLLSPGTKTKTRKGTPPNYRSIVPLAFLPSFGELAVLCSPTVSVCGSGVLLACFGVSFLDLGDLGSLYVVFSGRLSWNPVSFPSLVCFVLSFLARFRPACVKSFFRFER